MPRRYETEKPAISDEMIARVRAAAHQYILAGGSVFLDHQDAADRDSHIGNIANALRPTFQQALDDALDKARKALDTARVPLTSPDFDDAVFAANAANGDAGYCFGVCVAFEIVSMAFSNAAITIPTRTRRGRKGRR